MKLRLLLSVMAVALIFAQLPFLHSQEISSNRECEKNTLHSFFVSEKNKNPDEPRWSIVDRLVTENIKNCFFEKLKLSKSIKNIGAEKISFNGKPFYLISDGLIDAVAANMGYAAVYASSVKPNSAFDNNAKNRTIIKLSFSVKFDGDAYLHNIFETERIGNSLNFFEHEDGNRVNKNAECLKCHAYSTQKEKMFLTPEGIVDSEALRKL